MAHAGIKSSYSYLWGCLRAWTQTRVAAVILLSFVLAVGFLLVILSCALWANWLPLLVGAFNQSCEEREEAAAYPTLELETRPSLAREQP